MTYKGECFCGAVHIEVSGEPEGMGYCHCRSCRSWSGGPVNAFTLWKPGAVRVTDGAEQCRDIPEDAVERAAILQEMRRSPDDQSPDARIGRRVRGDTADAEVQPRRPHQLRRDGAADARWTAEAEGFPRRVRRIGRAGAGVTLLPPSLPTPEDPMQRYRRHARELQEGRGRPGCHDEGAPRHVADTLCSRKQGSVTILLFTARE